MAVSISTITKSVGWARSDVILALEEAFDIAEFHGATRTGIVTFAKERDGGGSTSGSATYEDVFTSTTTGIGTGLSFWVQRDSNGDINDFHVNRPGYGYTEGEYVTLSAEDIGGSANGAVAIGVTVSVHGGVSTVSYGTTSTFFVKNVGVGTDYPFGVLRHEIEANKKFGNSFRAFQVWSDYQLTFNVGSDFHPYSPLYNDEAADGGSSTYRDTSDGAMGYGYRYCGQRGLDLAGYNSDQYNPLTSQYFAHYGLKNAEAQAGSGTQGSLANNQTGAADGSNDTGSIIRFATANSPTTHELKLRVYQSSIDPKFAVFSFTQPTLSGTGIDDNTFLTFFMHNYTSSLWDYDHVFQSGLTLIKARECSNATNATVPRLNFETFIGGMTNWDHSYSQSYYNKQDANCWRTAHAGYAQKYLSSAASGNDNVHIVDGYETTGSQYSNADSDFSSNLDGGYNKIQPNDSANRIFVRRSGGHKSQSYSGTELSSDLAYNAVIKGIPVCSKMIPCPYYIPDDFVMIDFKYSASETNIQQGDTITISGSEVYEVIHGSYNQYGETAGILFCARRV